MPGFWRSITVILALGAFGLSAGAHAGSKADRLYTDAATLFQQGQFAEGTKLAEKALALREQSLGPNHTDVARSLDMVAAFYMAQNRNADAGPLFKRSLAIFESALGPDHVDVAQSHCNYGRWFEFEKRPEDAETHYQRCLDIREKARGTDHIDVADALDRLGLLYVKNWSGYDDDYGPDPEKLLKESLAIREKALGPQHLLVADSLHHLSLLYRVQKRFADALPLVQRSLEIREKALGSGDPKIAEARDDLVTLKLALGRFDDVRQPPAIGEQEKSGQQLKALLGVRAKDMDAATAQSLGWGAPRGVVVEELTGGTKLTIGDVILALDDEAIASTQQLATSIAAHRSKDNVTLQVFRHGAWVKIPVTLGGGASASGP